MSSVDYTVYTGFWTNWSDGKVDGATLTLGRADANLLIAFVAFFLTIVTSRLWAIISFVSHALLSTPEARDVLHHQRQALLRNNGGPAETTWTLIRLAWLWRKSSQMKRRIFPLLGVSFLLAVGFGVAAGFSSQVGRDSEVLLVPQNCAYYGPTADAGSSNNFWFPYCSRLRSDAATYAQACYLNGSMAAQSKCINRPYVQQRLNLSIDTNAPCPFDSEFCATPTSNLVLDTGFIDTHSDLGINAPIDKRAQYRTVVRCAPLAVKGYREPFEYAANTSFVRYHYGPQRTSNGAKFNYTYEYPDPNNAINMSQNGDHDSNWWNTDYSLINLWASPSNGSFTSANASGTFVPLFGLRRPDADVLLVFLSPNNIMYRQPTADPWYNSSQIAQSIQITMSRSGETTKISLWTSTEAASPLACQQSRQWCFGGAESGHCTPLASMVDIKTYIKALAGTNNETLQRVEWLNSVLDQQSSVSIVNLPSTLGGLSLTSRSGLSTGIQSFISDTQWQQDVIYWMSASLALMQQVFVTAAIGDNPPDPENIVPPATDEAQTICASQKIISQIHTSFSVLGLAFVLTFGILTILTSCILEPLTHCVQRRLKKNPYGRLEWSSTGVFQLQRMANEQLGLGDWHHCDNEIPTTAPGTLLAVLDISDERHPVLVRGIGSGGGNATFEKPHAAAAAGTYEASPLTRQSTLCSSCGSRSLERKASTRADTICPFGDGHIVNMGDLLLKDVAK